MQRTAFSLEARLGDKPPGKTAFLKGIQGEVSRPVWDRSYFYLNAKVQQVSQVSSDWFSMKGCYHFVTIFAKRYRYR